jgi:uncharacterized membrane protein YkvA (DUF1232 family)
MMKSFDQLLEEDIADYEGRHDELIYQAPAFYRLLTHLLDDARLPKRLRPLVLAAIAYFILPVDIIPEELEGPYGYVDDIWLCAFVAERVRREVGGEEILVDNWDGEAPVVELVEELLAEEELVSGEERRRVLEYIGFDGVDSF